VINPGTVVSFAASLPANTTTEACSRYTNVDPPKDEFGTEQ